MPSRRSNDRVADDAVVPTKPSPTALTMPKRKFDSRCAAAALSRSSPNATPNTAVDWENIVVSWKGCLLGCSNNGGCAFATKNAMTFTLHSCSSVVCSSAGIDWSGFVRVPKAPRRTPKASAGGVADHVLWATRDRQPASRHRTCDPPLGLRLTYPFARSHQVWRNLPLARA